MSNNETKYVLFGAGELGQYAMNYYGIEKIAYFIDNNPNKWGKRIANIKIINLESYLELCQKNWKIVISTSWQKACSIAEQLRGNNIFDYEVFTTQLFENCDLMMNQYEIFEGSTEEMWNEKLIQDKNNLLVRKYVDEIKDNIPLFHEVEIETINRCNGVCSFCPVNAKIDSRERSVMSKDLFEKIILELESLYYAGRIALFSNNEPLLDSRILEFSIFMREHLPKAKIHLFTNGTLLTEKLFTELIPYLDELIIDNYDQELQLIPSVKQIKEYVEQKGSIEIRKKVKILLRKPTEILSSRGG